MFGRKVDARPYISLPPSLTIPPPHFYFHLLTLPLFRFRCNCTLSGADAADMVAFETVDDSFGDDLDEAIAAGEVGGSSVATTATTATTPAPTVAAEADVIGVATVLYPYDGRDDEELTVAEGDVLDLLDITSDPQWYTARDSGGRQGVVPATYVQLEGDLATGAAGAGAAGVTEDAGAGEAAVPVASAEAPVVMVSIYAYEGRDEEELTFGEGEVLDVTDNSSDPDWLTATLRSTGASGVAPRTYLDLASPEVLASAPPPAAASAAADATADADVETPAEAPTDEVDGDGVSEDDGVDGAAGDDGAGDGPAPTGRYVAAYDFTAAADDEVSFTAGTEMEVTDTEDPVWFTATVAGVSGVVPASYIRYADGGDE